MSYWIDPRATVSHIFRSYAIAHPRLQSVSDALRRAIQEPAGRSLILVIGPTGVGKTALRLRIEQELKERFLAAGEPDPGRIPVVGLEAVAPTRVISVGKTITAERCVRSKSPSSTTKSITLQ